MTGSAVFLCRGAFALIAAMAWAAPTQATAPEGTASLDDTTRAFEKAVEAVEAKPNANSPGSPPSAGAFDSQTREQFERMLKESPELSAEMAIRRLMATYPSPEVSQRGAELIQALPGIRLHDEQAEAARLLGLIADAKKAVTQAKTPADLDPVLHELQAIRPNPLQGFSSDEPLRLLRQQTDATTEFVSQWQNYLSASAAGKTEEAQGALRQILANRQFIELEFFPRSEILERLDGPPVGISTGPSPEEQILTKVLHLEDISPALAKIQKLPNGELKINDIVALEQDRANLTAGIPITLDLRGAVNGQSIGDDFSRMESLELLAMLPYYFGTQKSDPPKKDETLTSYLDRMAAAAYAAGNLARYQRVLTVQTAIAYMPTNAPPPTSPIQMFLAGLSQEAAGDYLSAVVSYENSLKDYDQNVPAKIVGERLEGIKEAHLDAYAKGIYLFHAPPEPPSMQELMRNRFPTPPPPILPIPFTITIDPSADQSAPPKNK